MKKIVKNKEQVENITKPVVNPYVKPMVDLKAQILAILNEKPQIESNHNLSDPFRIGQS